MLTYVMIRVSSPGSPKTPSTNSGRDVKLYLLQDLPSSKLNLVEKAEFSIFFPYSLPTSSEEIL